MYFPPKYIIRMYDVGYLSSPKFVVIITLYVLSWIILVEEHLKNPSLATSFEQF